MYVLRSPLQEVDSYQREDQGAQRSNRPTIEQGLCVDLPYISYALHNIYLWHAHGPIPCRYISVFMYP